MVLHQIFAIICAITIIFYACVVIRSRIHTPILKVKYPVLVFWFIFLGLFALCITLLNTDIHDNEISIYDHMNGNRMVTSFLFSVLAMYTISQIITDDLITNIDNFFRFSTQTISNLVYKIKYL